MSTKETVKKQSRCNISPEELMNKVNSLLDNMGCKLHSRSELMKKISEKNFPYQNFMASLLEKKSIIKKRGTTRSVQYWRNTYSIGTIMSGVLLDELRNSSKEKCDKRKTSNLIIKTDKPLVKLKSEKNIQFPLADRSDEILIMEIKRRGYKVLKQVTEFKEV